MYVLRILFLNLLSLTKITMKDPSLTTRRKKPKLKLVVSFNGQFRRIPLSGKLRYAGGESKIISVDRYITFSRLKSKIADLFVQHDAISLPSRFSLSYLHHKADEDDERSVGPIGSDDDVRSMISEFEKLESIGKRCRLWVFVCHNDDSSNQSLDVYRDVDDGFDRKRVLYANYENSSDGRDLLCGKERVLSENLTTQLSKSEKDGKFGNDSLRKMVLKRQLVTKKSNKIRGVYDGFEKNGSESDGPFIDIRSEGQSSFSTERETLGFGGELYKVNMLDYEYRKGDAVGSEKFGEVLHVAVSNPRPLNPNDGNLPVELNGSVRGSLGQARLSSYMSSVHYAKPSCNSNMNSVTDGFSDRYDLRSFDLACLSNMNRENILPFVNRDMVRNGFAPHTTSNQFVGGANRMRAWGGFNSGIRSHGFGSSETGSPRICPYYLRNRGNVNEMGNHCNFRLDKRPGLGRVHPVPRLSSSISKHGQASRSNNFTLWKTWSGSHNKFGVQGPGDYGTNIHSKSSKLPYCGREIPKIGDENLGRCFLAYDGAICVNSAIKDPSPCPRSAGNQIDCLTGDSETLELSRQTLCTSFLDMPLNVKILDDHNKKLHLMNRLEIINISSFPENPCSSSGTELSCNIKLLDVKADCKISLDNLSLSSKRAEWPVPSPARSDIYEASQMPESKHSNAMDEEDFISGLQFENSSIAAYDSSSGSDAKMEKHNHINEVIQQSHLTDISIDKKDEDTDGNISSKANGRTSTEIAAFYNHLATGALQTIKNSDLEYIKELGSGAYGTVYHGKWKGSDVAIKRIKPNCFNEGTKEEDRLVADFWKEAHILGQLHHPNIVALYGVVTDGPVNNLATVTEYMVNGSLKQVLQRKDRTIDRRKRLIIAMDAAFGMEYLHEKNIVHFDLKSHNLLVNMRDPQRPVCKIGDLGLSKIKQRTLISGGVRGTIPWMAPELFNAKRMVSEKVDVYSFGIVMWELLTGEEPYANLRSEEIIAGIIKGNLRPETPSWCDPAWRSLMERCWSSEPNTRPSFSEVAKELRTMASAANIK